MKKKTKSKELFTARAFYVASLAHQLRSEDARAGQHVSSDDEYLSAAAIRIEEAERFLADGRHTRNPFDVVPVDEAAARLGCSAQTVRNWMVRLKLARIDGFEVDEIRKAMRDSRSARGKKARAAKKTP